MSERRRYPSFWKTFFGTLVILIPMFWAFWYFGPRNEPLQFLALSTGGAVVCGLVFGVMNALLNRGSKD